jgi:dihydroorotate dehydrogenase/NAD-dependent dihydropyrimidine dehydrogenase PreA subunit
MPADLHTDICGFTFKNPVAPAAGDIVATVSNCERVVQAGVGGIFTKTFSPLAAPRRRVHPSLFALRGRGYEQAGAILSAVGNWPEHIDVILKRDIPEFKRLCLEAEIPLVVSWYGPVEVREGELSEETIDTWLDMANGVDAAGADLQELNFSCPLVSHAISDNHALGMKLLKEIIDAGFRAGIKIHPTWEPLEELAEGWAEAGAKFITAHNLNMQGLIIDIDEERPKYVPGMVGYSPGRLLLPWSLCRVARIKKRVSIPVFAVSGVYTADDVIQYLLAGASLIQIHTAVYFRGLGVFREILNGVEAWMERKGYNKLDDFRGNALPGVASWDEIRAYEKYPYAVPPDSPYVPVVDEDECNLCGLCVACVHGVFNLERNNVLIDEGKCENCGFCITLCPSGAIKLVEKRNRTRVIWEPGEDMALPHQETLRQLLSEGT